MINPKYTYFNKKIYECETVLSEIGRDLFFKNTESTLQLFINLAEDLSLMGHDSCIVVDPTFLSDRDLIPSMLDCKLFHVATIYGHRAIKEKVEFLYLTNISKTHEEETIEKLSTYKWIFFYTRENVKKLSKKLNKLYSVTCFSISEKDEKNLIIPRNVWYRMENEDEYSYSTTTYKKYQHLSKGGHNLILENCLTP